MQNSYCKIVFSLILLLSTTLLFATEKREHFLSYGPGVAAASMGGTFTAIGNDVSVIYYNPALIGHLESNEISANYWSLLADTRYMFLGIALQLSEKTGFAISGTQLATDGIEVRETLSDNGKKETASQNVINMAYGGYVENLDLHYGIGIKYLYYNIVGYSDSGGALDAGLYKRVKQWKKTAIDSGIVVQNLVNIPIKLKDDDENAPFIAKGGLGIKTLLFPKYSKQKDLLTYDTLTLGIDFGTEDSEFIYSFGGEYCLYDLILFRGGYSGEEVNVGFGIKCYGFQFDYSYQFTEIDSINKIGFLYKWGGEKAKPTYSKTQTVTDDFQQVYQQANRIYENSVRDSRTLIETNKIDEAIALLYRTIPLQPEKNEEAITLLQVAQQKQVANKTNDYLNKAQRLINKKEVVKSYQEALNALQVAPNSNVKQFIEENYNNTTKINATKEKEIQKYENLIISLLNDYNFELAEQEVKKLEILSPSKAQKYYEDIKNGKENAANQYIVLARKAQSNNNLVEAYCYFSEAEELVGNDAAISDLKNKIKKKIVKSKENTFEDRVYTEKLYYLAAISFANNNSKDTYEELQDFNPSFKWNDILKQYLKKAGLINSKKLIKGE